MVYRRFGLLKYVTPFVAAAAFVLGCGARAAETAAATSAQSINASETDGMSWCRVSGDQVNIRVGPNTTNQPVSTLHSGEYIRARAVQNNWLEMEWPRNVPAWVLKDTVAVSSPDAKTGTIRTAKARIMGLGSNNAPEVAVLDRGARVLIVGESGDWFQVQAPAAVRAYIYAKYVVVGVQAPSEAAPAAKLAAHPHRDEVAEPVSLPESTRFQKETENHPAEVVIVQQQASWPQVSKIASASVSPLAHAPAAPKKISDDSMFGAAATEVVSSKTKSTADAQVALAAAAERKRADDAELARKAEIESQAKAAAERKHVLEIEIAKLSEARKKAEADEVARQAAEKKRLEDAEKERLTATELRKAELLELSRLASERKRLEDAEKERVAAETRKKVEIETQTKAVAEKKALLEVELAQLSEAKKKAEDEERTRMALEKKRIAEAETARIAAESKKAELEEQAQKAAEKKKGLEAEIARLADAKKKEEQDATTRAAREKKLIEDAEIARKETETRHKLELKDLTAKEAEKKHLDDIEAARTAADTKRRADLAEQERVALARKKSLEDEIARMHAEKQRYEEEAVARAAAEKKKNNELEAARVTAEKKQAAELEAARVAAAEKKRVAELEAARVASELKHAAELETARVAAEKKRVSDLEAARVASELKHAAELETARVAAEKKHNDEVAAAKLAAERKRIEDEAARVAGERKRSEEAAAQAQKAADQKRAEEAEVARLAAEKKRVELETAKATAERNHAAEVARLAAETKRIEDEIALAAAESKRKIEQENLRQANDLKLAEQAKAAAASRNSHLPEPGTDDAARVSKSVALITDKTLMLSESDLASDKGEPNESNYNSGYVPQRIVDLRNKYVVPKETPARAQVVAETIDIDVVYPTAKIAAAPTQPASVKTPEIADVAKPVWTGPAVREVNDNNFATEIDSYKGGVLVDFSATWCGPCRNLAPTVDSLAEEFRGKVKVVKIDLDQAPSTARRFGVSCIPYLMIYKDGKIIDTHLGAPSREFLRAWLQSISDAPAKIDAPVKAEAPAKPKDIGMRLIPTEQRTIVSDVGQLDRISGSEIAGVKYVLRNGGYVTRYIIEPSDVDMSSMVGRTISITGYSIGRSYSDVSVIQMKNASTFG